MELKEFCLLIKEQYSDKSIQILPDTDFRDNDDFDSLVGMAILTVIKENFDYGMTVPEFLDCKTPADLYAAIINGK